MITRAIVGLSELLRFQWTGLEKLAFRLRVHPDTKVLSYRPGTHVAALDGIRGIAIMLVMLHHFTIYGMGKPTTLIDKLFYGVTAAGWCGVDLFFVLSAFLITGILLDAKGGEYFFRNFYIRRILRIFPLYYGFLFVVFTLLPHMMYVSDNFGLLINQQGWYWSYLVNLPIAFEGWPRLYTLGHFWSLAVEEQFYLFWPLVVFFARRRQLMLICVVCFAAGFAVRLGFVLIGYPLAAYVLTPARMDTLAVGAFLALVVRQRQRLLSLSRWMWPIGGTSAAALGTIFVWQRGLDSTDMVVQTIGYSVLAVMFGALLSVALTSPGGSKLGKIFAHPVLTFFGRYSYALYIFHHPIALFMQQSLLGEGGLPTFLGVKLPAQVLFATAATVISLSFALVSWHCYEENFVKLKVLFVSHKVTGADRDHHKTTVSSSSVSSS
jgi:peptidoglycan/LPS O-acetylase OafA/YrhL